MEDYSDIEFPERDVYFFFTADSDFSESVAGVHLSRIGTVGIVEDSSNTLQNRLRQHRGNERGTYSGGRNHRGLIFRLHVGIAIIEREDLHDEFPNWGTPLRDLKRDIMKIREEKHPLGQRVSEYIRSLPFLIVDINDEPGPESERFYVERKLGRSARPLGISPSRPARAAGAVGASSTDGVQVRLRPAVSRTQPDQIDGNSDAHDGTLARDDLRVRVVQDAVRHGTRPCPPLLGRQSVGPESRAGTPAMSGRRVNIGN